jgi:dipeptidyl aminopeptidase/acylaminoacyl peptidase
MTDSVAAPRTPYGTWPSPISAADVAKGQVTVSFPLVRGTDVWWQEGRPEEGGRVTVVHCDATGSPHALLPSPWNARTRVHEYGGRSYLPVPIPGPDDPDTEGDGQGVVFANYADQRLYLVPGPGVTPRPLTPEPAGETGQTTLRFADFILSGDGKEVWCVQERHEDGKISRAIVAVPLDGSAANDPDAIRQLVTGADFFAFPTLSPDGSRLAWICWNHPRMPWDGTELRVGLIADGVPGPGRLVKGGMRESVLAPVWRDNTSLYVVSDWPGWWNLYQVGLLGEPAQALYPAEEEFAEPLWQLGERPFARLGDGRLAVLHGQGGMRLGLLDPETGELTDPELPVQEFTSGLAADSETVVAVAGGPARPLAVVRINVASGTCEVLRSESEDVPDAGYLPVPSQVRLDGLYGRSVHALVYPPAHPDAVAPDGELPPYVVWVHSGPTSHAVGLLDLEKAYFTSRGIGIIDVNYGGSTGYGRSYRERLRTQWGVVDVEDAASAAQALAANGDADPARLAIRGGSAGGWTALAAVTTLAARQRVFSAAASYYGVADLRELAAESHDFESHYLDGLIGPLPGFHYVYEERSPAGHVTDATAPVLLLQGLDDPIVSPAQSRGIAADLAAHGIRHALLMFQGESHGFRRADTIAAALEAELSFYGQVLGFDPPGIPRLKLIEPAKPSQPAEPGAGASAGADASAEAGADAGAEGGADAERSKPGVAARPGSGSNVTVLPSGSGGASGGSASASGGSGGAPGGPSSPAKAASS